MRQRNFRFRFLVLALVLTVTGLLSWTVHNRIHRPAIVQTIDPDRPMVAITFDDGPNPRHTPEILDILYRQQVRATFFLVGEKIPGNELLLEEMVAAGHELECHTYSHSDLEGLSGYEIRQEVIMAQEALEEALPGHRFRYLRPPYGNYSRMVEEYAGLPLVEWDLDSRDSENIREEEIYFNVVNQIQDKDVVIFHDGERAALVLESILETLKEEGYQMVTLEQLVEYSTLKERETLPIYP